VDEPSDAVANSIIIDALVKLEESTFKELFRISGNDEVLAALEPYREEEELRMDPALAHRILSLVISINNNTRAFVDLHGSEKALKLLCPKAYGIGQEIGTRFASQNPGLMTNDKSVWELVCKTETIFGQKANYSVISEDKIETEIEDCHLRKFIRYESCKQREAFYQGLVGVVNPSFEFFFDRMMTKGDTTCHWVIRRKVMDKERVQETKEMAKSHVEGRV
jgi:hypothetical protein